MTQQSELTFLMVKVSGGDETIRQAVASAVQIILNDLKPASPSTPAIEASGSQGPDRLLPAPVQREISPSPGGEHHAATAKSEEPAVPARRKRRTPPSAPASTVPAQASNIPASSARGAQEKTHSQGRKLRSDATLLECSDRPGFALTIQEIATKTGYPIGTIRGWLTKAGREWFTIDHLKYRRMVRAPAGAGGGNGDAFYRPVAKKPPSATAGLRHPDELERDLADED